jgi:hypothetical protein
MASRQDNKAQREAFLAILDQPFGFEARKGAEIERVARAVLAKVGIVNLRQIAQPSWITNLLGHPIAPSWRSTVTQFSKNSPESIAAAALDCLERVRLAIKGKDADATAEEAVTLGALAVQLGKKMTSRLTGKASIEQEFGTDAYRKAEAEQIIVAFNDEMRRQPRPKKGDAERAVAKTMRINVRKVQRARAQQSNSGKKLVRQG